MLLVSPRFYKALLRDPGKHDSCLDLISEKDLVLSIDGSYRSTSGVAAFAVIKSSKNTLPRLVSKGIYTFEDNKAQSRSEIAEFSGYRSALTYCSMLSDLPSRRVLVETDCIDVERIYTIALKKITKKDISALDERFLKGVPSKQKAPASSLPDRSYRLEALNEQLKILEAFQEKGIDLSNFKVLHRPRRSTIGMTLADNFAASLTLSEGTKQKISRSKAQEANLHRYVAHSKGFYEGLANFFESSEELLSFPRVKGWKNTLEKSKKETRLSLTSFLEQEEAFMKSIFRKGQKGVHKGLAISHLLDLPFYEKTDLLNLFFDEDVYSKTNSTEYRTLTEAYEKIKSYLDFYSHVKAPSKSVDNSKKVPTKAKGNTSKKVRVKGVAVNFSY